MKKIEPRFIAGPPGTGKTHGFILDLYKELLLKYQGNARSLAEREFSKERVINRLNNFLVK